jgi:hypothetical protein
MAEPLLKVSLLLYIYLIRCLSSCNFIVFNLFYFYFLFILIILKKKPNELFSWSQNSNMTTFKFQSFKLVPMKINFIIYKIMN